MDEKTKDPVAQLHAEGQITKMEAIDALLGIVRRHKELDSQEITAMESAVKTLVWLVCRRAKQRHTKAARMGGVYYTQPQVASAIMAMPPMDGIE